MLHTVRFGSLPCVWHPTDNPLPKRKPFVFLTPTENKILKYMVEWKTHLHKSWIKFVRFFSLIFSSFVFPLASLTLALTPFLQIHLIDSYFYSFFLWLEMSFWLLGLHYSSVRWWLFGFHSFLISCTCFKTILFIGFEIRIQILERKGYFCERVLFHFQPFKVDCRYFIAFLHRYIFLDKLWGNTDSVSHSWGWQVWFCKTNDNFFGSIELWNRMIGPIVSSIYTLEIKCELKLLQVGFSLNLFVE